MNLRKRLAELERKFTSDPIELVMPDGRTEVLRGPVGEATSGRTPCAGPRMASGSPLLMRVRALSCGIR